jgi:hypothetical protein
LNKEFGLNFKQYDAVRLKKINLPIPCAKNEFNLRQPEIGDIAYIIEIYSTPPGYELECSDANGSSITFSAKSVERLVNTEIAR